jgi:hypothetical protein
MWVYFNEPEHSLLSKCFINVEDALKKAFNTKLNTVNI